jgi:hypothetical protein
MVLTVSFVLSPAIGFLVTVAPEKAASQELDASVEASGPHDLMSSRIFGLLKTAQAPKNKGIFRFLLNEQKASRNPLGPDRP